MTLHTNACDIKEGYVQIQQQLKKAMKPIVIGQDRRQVQNVSMGRHKQNASQLYGQHYLYEPV